MVRDVATIDQSWTYRRTRGAQAAPPRPGLLMLFSGDQARLLAVPLGTGAHVLGRDGVGGVLFDDPRMSRHHAEVSFDGADWHIRDLGSHNGTFVDGKRLSRARVTHKARVLRLGNTLFGLMSDVGPCEGAAVERGQEVVLGPTLRRAWDEIERAARQERNLHITGESGSGKELAARHFHGSGPRAEGPFIAVNCATIPPGLAERLLFGAKKGAYSGADTDVNGHLQAAHGGTLFLDEIGELAMSVQAKLLRVIESREVLPLGALRARPVNLAICTATHRDLRAEASAGRFREDLLYRIATPAVSLPPLRERLEDIPWLVQAEVDRLGGPTAHVSLVEACLLRGWPGNVRELRAEVAQAVARASAQGSPRVEAAHLGASAGLSRPAPAGTVSRDAIMETLHQAGGNVSRAARALGMHRTQLRRWVAANREQVGTRVEPEDGDDSSHG